MNRFDKVVWTGVLVIFGLVLANCAYEAWAHEPEPGFVNGFGLNIVVDGKLSAPGADSLLVSDSNYSIRIKNQNSHKEATVRITLDGETLVEGITLPGGDQEIFLNKGATGPQGFGDLFKHLDTKAGEIRGEFTWVGVDGQAHVEVVTIKVKK